jgi:hypothetical protein
MIKITEVWTDNFTEFVDDIVNNITSISMVILDCLNEVDYYDRVFNKIQIDKLLTVTQQYNVPVKILTANSNKNKGLDRFSHIEIICWPTFWFARTYRVWTYPDAYNYNMMKGVSIKNDNVYKDVNFTYPYICLNNIQKNHIGILINKVKVLPRLYKKLKGIKYLLNLVKVR